MTRNANMQPFPGEFDDGAVGPEQNGDRPTVKLIGQDGNAFAILGACHRAAKQAGWSQEKWSAVRDEMMAGDYDQLLGAAMKHFDVE